MRELADSIEPLAANNQDRAMIVAIHKSRRLQRPLGGRIRLLPVFLATNGPPSGNNTFGSIRLP